MKTMEWFFSRFSEFEERIEFYHVFAVLMNYTSRKYSWKEFYEFLNFKTRNRNARKNTHTHKFKKLIVSMHVRWKDVAAFFSSHFANHEICLWCSVYLVCEMKLYEIPSRCLNMHIEYDMRPSFCVFALLIEHLFRVVVRQPLIAYMRLNLLANITQLSIWNSQNAWHKLPDAIPTDISNSSGKYERKKWWKRANSIE